MFEFPNASFFNRGKISTFFEGESEKGKFAG
jgi:hypothetical protein